METMNDEGRTTRGVTRARVRSSAGMQRRPSLAQRGFTLIELIVVVTIIGILAGIAVANVKTAQQKAREAALKDDLREMRGAIDNFYADKQRYPQSLAELKDQHYLRAIPKDPMTGKADWEEIQAPVDTTDTGGSAADPTAAANNQQSGGQPGVYDVKTLAEGRSLNGEEFKSW